MFLLPIILFKKKSAYYNSSLVTHYFKDMFVLTVAIQKAKVPQRLQNQQDIAELHSKSYSRSEGKVSACLPIVAI